MYSNITSAFALHPKSEIRRPTWSRSTIRTSVLALLVLLNVSTAFAGASSGMEVKGVWGGPVQAVFVEPSNPDIVYIGSGRRLVILSVTDAGPGQVNVVELGSIDLGNLVFDIAVRNGYAWVATKGEPNYFCVVDVHNPAQPQLKWSNQGESIVVRTAEVELYGDMAYVRTFPGGNVVYYRISTFEADPAHNVPELIDVGIGLVCEFSIQGNKLISVTNNVTFRELRVYTINPDYSLTQCGMSPLPSRGQAVALAVDGGVACATMRLGLGNEGCKLATYDISDPCVPVLQSELSGFLFLRDVALAGGYAFAVDHAGFPPDPVSWNNAKGLTIYDIHSNPTQPPVLVGQYHPHGAIAFVKVYGTRAYVTDEGRGLVVLDVSTPANPIKTGDFYSPSFPRKMDLVDDLLYVTDAWGGFAILDVENPQSPQVAGIYNSPAVGLAMDHWAIRVRDQNAYLSAGWGGLEIVNVSNSAQPTLLGAFRVPPDLWYSRGIDLVDGSQFSPAWQGRLIAAIGLPVSSGCYFKNLDVSDPQDIQDIGTLFVSSTDAATLDIAGQYLHVAGFYPYVVINDSEPTTSFLSHKGAATAIDLEANGDFLYLANRDSFPNSGITNGLRIYDISSPANPIPIPGSVFPIKTCSGVDVWGGHAYLTGQDANNSNRDSLFELDMTNPGAPTLLSKIAVNCPGRTVVVGNGLAIVTTDDSGLVIVSTSVTPGDSDGSGVVDGDDIQGFIHAMLNPGAESDLTRRADMDGNDVVNPADVPLFVDALIGPTGPKGACCLPYGGTGCAMYSQGDCLAHGGTYHGDGVACESVACRGACCYTDGTCIQRSSAACAASNGTYHGDGGECGACPSGNYKNEISPITSFVSSGPNLALVDDMTLAGTGARDLSYFDLAVFGNGGGPFDVYVSLYYTCPFGVSMPIQGAEFVFTAVPDDGGRVLVADSFPPGIELPDTFWMAAEFSTPQAGWIIAGQAEIGTTEDRFGTFNSPIPSDCAAHFGGNPWAGFWANVRCVPAGALQAGVATPRDDAAQFIERNGKRYRVMERTQKLDAARPVAIER